MVSTGVQVIQVESPAYRRELRGAIRRGRDFVVADRYGAEWLFKARRFRPASRWLLAWWVAWRLDVYRL